MSLPVILLGIAVLGLSIGGLIVGHQIGLIAKALTLQSDINQEQEKINKYVHAVLTALLTQKKEGSDV